MTDPWPDGVTSKVYDAPLPTRLLATPPETTRSVRANPVTESGLPDEAFAKFSVKAIGETLVAPFKTAGAANVGVGASESTIMVPAPTLVNEPPDVETGPFTIRVLPAGAVNTVLVAPRLTAPEKITVPEAAAAIVPPVNAMGWVLVVPAVAVSVAPLATVKFEPVRA